LPQQGKPARRMQGGVSLFALLAFVCYTSGALAAKPPRARVTVFVLTAESFPADQKGRVANILGKALKKNPQLEVKDSDRLLVEFAGEVPGDTITKAREALENGVRLLNEGDAATAITPLEEAITSLEGVLPFIKKEMLARALMALGAAQARLQQPRKALATFIQLLTWRPVATFDINSFGDQALSLFEKAQQAVKANRRGSVELISDPPGAQAYLDGRRVGLTPTVAFGLKVGDHYATFKLQGYVKAAQKITVNPAKQLKYTTSLRRSEKYLLLDQSLRDAQRSLGKPKASPEMVSLSTFLFIDQVIFVSLEQSGSSSITVQAYLYDLRSKLALSRAALSLSPKNLKDLQRLAEMLYLNVTYDGTLVAPPEPPPPTPPKRRPFYSTWWFWTAVVVGSAGVVLPIVYWPTAKTWPEGYGVIRVQN
jgi:tetratricopeptide (TPR) repeat protein